MSSLYSFTELQKVVEDAFEIEIDPEGGDFKVEQKVLRLENRDIEKIRFKNGRIFFKDGEQEFKGFLVKERNYNKAYRDNILNRPSHLPKFHTTMCDTLERMKAIGRFNDTYIFSNQCIERRESPEGGGEMSDLRMCGNCLKIDEDIDRYIFTGTFVEEYLDSGKKQEGFNQFQLPKQYEKDEWGYVNGWDEISLQYRAQQGFKCEQCGLDLSTNKYYLEVHHLNSKKTDNRESNLQCLCTKCHANVDRFHRENFYNQAENRAKLKDFINLYSR